MADAPTATIDGGGKRGRKRAERKKEPQVVREGMRRPFQGYVSKPSGLRIEEEEGEE
jgi:hypothetical protein